MDTGPAGQAAPERRKVPPGRARHRSQLMVTLSLAALAALWFVPVLILRPMADPALLAFSTGVAVGLGISLTRGMSNARGSRRLLTETSRFLTAGTWTGPRTIDLRGLRRIRARRIAGRGPVIDYLMVTDTAGVRVSFRDQSDIRLIRRMLAEQAREHPDLAPVRVSRLAQKVLGVRPLPRAWPALWALASAELTILIALGCAFSIIALAGR